MIDVLRFVIGLAADVVRRRAGLVAENVLLRQQRIAAALKTPRGCRRGPERSDARSPGEVFRSARSTPAIGERSKAACIELLRRMTVKARGHYDQG